MRAAAPVQITAQQLAVANIRNIGSHWSRMRIGVSPASVYMVPASRRRRGSPRPNLAELLMDKSMEPALDQEQEKVVSAVEAMLDGLFFAEGF